MGTALFVLLWWLALFGWWLALVGTNSGLELIAGAGAGLLGALLALAVRRSGLLRFRFEARWLAKTLKVPWRVVYELGAVFWALALHLVGLRRLNSRYRAFDFPAGGDDPTSRGRRAVAAAADSLSPNTMPVDVDRERKVALRHELDPRRASAEMP
jgi:multisubunit Na+/H+ antiporter MnhE subunit